MNQTDQLPTPATYPPPAATLPQARRIAVPGGLRAAWRYRAFVGGLAALVLALLAEQLMRAGNPDADPALGVRLLQLAVVLVGLVAWVREGLRLPGRSTKGAKAVDSTAARRVLVGAPSGTSEATVAPLAPSSSLWARLGAGRARLGWAGTGIGLAVTAGLAIWCFLLLRPDFSNPWAPVLWVAALAALVLTFVGVAPWPAGATLVPHDPAEPAIEPPVSRGEWLAIGLIMLVAVAVRVWNLDTIPVGPYTDEGDRGIEARHLIRGELVNQQPYVFFGTGWWGVPNAYFWLVGQSIIVFGNTLAGIRMVHALAGIGTVWFAYRTGRVAWSPRVGLLAGALLAVSDFAIQFSRTAGESTITLFFWTACFYFLYKAIKTQRPLDWVLGGLAAGFSLYGYVSAKLLPVFLVLLAAYLLLRWGRAGIKRYLPGLVLMAVAAGLTYAPNGLYILQHPDAFFMRSNGVAITSPVNQQAFFGDNPTPLHTADVLLHQFTLSFAAFDVGAERGPFYPTGQPILPVLWAALWLLGTAYVVWRLGDVRYGILGLWLIGGLAGAALTNDTPTLQRVVGMVPLLALIPAVFLDRVASGAPPLRWRVPLWSRAGVLQGTMRLFLVFIVGLVGLQTLAFYFGPYTAAQHWDWYSLAGRYVQTLDPKRDMVYQMDVPELFWFIGPAVFLADRVQATDMINPGDELPVVNNAGKNVHFIVFPSNGQYLPILQEYYPGGSKSAITRANGDVFATAYRAGQDAIDAQRQVTARYGPPGGPLFERSEPRLGTLAPLDQTSTIQPPSWMTYPLSVQWAGGLVVPMYGTYKFNLTAPAGASFEIDGRAMVTATVGSGVNEDTRVVLAKGIHQVHLLGTLPNAQGQVELRWGTDNGLMVPVGQPYLWAGPPGAWLGEAYPQAPPDFLTTPKLSLGDTVPAMERRDPLLGWRGFSPTPGGASTPYTSWQATLRAPQTGTYSFDVQTEGQMTLWIDGQIVGGKVAGGQVVNLPVQVPLTTGDHPVEVRYLPARDGAPFELYWQPPNGEHALIPPSALQPIAGGAWLPDERPGVPSPDAALIGTAPPAFPVAQVGTITGQDTWKQAHGVAVLPDGRIVVGDTGNHRLLIYRADGTLERMWGSDGQGDGQFNALDDVAVEPDGTIAALDGENGDVQLFDSSGKELAHLTHDALGLTHAQGIAWAPDGTLYVADTAGSRVVHISRDGAVLASFHDAATGDILPLEQPVDVAVTADGTVYAVDLRSRIVRFNAQGLIDRQWVVPIGGNRGGSHLTVWNTNLVLTNPDDGSLRLLDTGSGTVAILHVPGATPLNLNIPVGAATGPDGRLYIMDSENNRIVILAPAQ